MPRRRSRRRRLRKRTGRTGRRLKKRQGDWNMELPAFSSDVYGAKRLTEAVSNAAVKKMKSMLGGSSSATQTENKSIWTENMDNGVKYHTMNITYKKSRISKLTNMLTPPGSTYELVATGNNSLQGLQNNATVIRNDTIRYRDFVTALNNGVAITLAQIGRQVNLTQHKIEIEFANAGNTTAELDIYFCIDKKTDTSTSDINTIWSNGLAQENNDVSAPVETTGTPWLDPRKTKLFRISYWTKKRSCVLTAGEKCKLTVNFNMNRNIDYGYLGANTIVRGITSGIMLVQRGTLGDAVKQFTVGAAQQTLTPSKIIWFYKSTIKGAILDTLPRVHKQVGGNLPTTLPALFTIDEDTGEPEDAMDPLEYA